MAGNDSERFVELRTTMGNITFELYTEHAPKACENFRVLAQSKYYDGTSFHRIIPNFMIQGGDPSGTGRGGTSIWKGPLRHSEDEINDLQFTGAGILAMANSGPNTNKSQFFITLAPTPWLNGKHTIFGRVYSRMGDVQRMGLVQTDKQDRPLQDVTILSAGPPGQDSAGALVAS